ncbi:MAG TPA: beta-L-arabinofuranosidase domain-containing protein, partial [Spirochaetia bacterium]|nr:beta-L-arabinofuranosidase domain-containing protein [Spirochaetia bacterium]
MKKKMWCAALFVMSVWSALSNCALGQEAAKKVSDIWRPLLSTQEVGVLGERVDLWRKGRMWYMLDAQDGYLLSGFESRPGSQAWQGEHVGKWLHAATLAYEQTHDEKLLKALQAVVERLLAAQKANGYLGTYSDDYTFIAKPENVRESDIVDDIIAPKNKGKQPKPKAQPGGGWDTWTHRYNIYGLLTYEKFHPDPRVVAACKKMADLLIEVYGEGKHDLTKYGSRQGISATTLLESIVMLYERTQDKKYLDFAEHIVAMSENNPKLRLMGTMLENGSVVYPGEGKAYQLMANLLGYYRLYACTGDDRYLKTVQNGWEDIRSHHLYVTGGPWGLKMPYNGNGECFALPEDFAPANATVEVCSTTTWIQLNLHLLELTGQARYAAEAERAVFNALIEAQYKEGIAWVTHPMVNQDYQGYVTGINCCASSGPRALEMFSRHLVGEVDGAVSFAYPVPGSAVLPEKFGCAKIKVTGNYPVSPRIGIWFEQASGKEFAVEFRDPDGARLISARVNGRDLALSRNDRGFYRLSQSWKSGDEIAVDFEFLLKSHTELSKDGQKWVAFTYGPWALAQKTDKGTAIAEPLIGKDLTSQAASEWLEPCPIQDGGTPKFRIRNTQ